MKRIHELYQGGDLVAKYKKEAERVRIKWVELKALGFDHGYFWDYWIERSWFCCKF